jgi:hypothetical protein
VTVSGWVSVISSDAAQFPVSPSLVITPVSHVDPIYTRPVASFSKGGVFPREGITALRHFPIRACSAAT